MTLKLSPVAWRQPRRDEGKAFPACAKVPRFERHGIGVKCSWNTVAGGDEIREKQGPCHRGSELLRQCEAWRRCCASPTKDGSVPGASRVRGAVENSSSRAALSIDAPSTLPNNNLLTLAPLLA